MGKRKVTRDQIVDNPIREIPDGWFLANVTDSDLPYETILDSKKLESLTVQGQNIEDFIHEAATLDRSSQTSVSAAASNQGFPSINELQIHVLKEISKVQGTNLQSEAQESFEDNLISLSDQYIAVKAIIGEEKAVVLSNEEFKQWTYFSKIDKNNVNGLLQFSITNDNPEMFSHSLLLLAEGEKATWLLYLDERELTIYYAIEKGSIKIVKSILEIVDTELKKDMLTAIDEDEASSLHWAVNQGEAEMLKVILEALADEPELKESILTAIDGDGNSPLHWAVYQGKPEMVKVILEAVADEPELKKSILTDGYVYNPLDRAIISGKP